MRVFIGIILAILALASTGAAPSPKPVSEIDRLRQQVAELIEENNRLRVRIAELEARAKRPTSAPAPSEAIETAIKEGRVVLGMTPQQAMSAISNHGWSVSGDRTSEYVTGGENHTRRTLTGNSPAPHRMVFDDGKLVQIDE